jgi:DNA mismatch repair protein MutL
MLDLGRMHRLVVTEQNRNRKKEQVSHSLLFSLEYHMNEIEKNKYKSIKKFLPELGFDIKVAHENVLRVDAVPTGLKETQVVKFIEELFEIMEYRTEDQFMEFYNGKWSKMQSKSRFDFIYKNDAEQVIRDFSQLGFPAYLPDGKCCYVELPLEDLKNKF